MRARACAVVLVLLGALTALAASSGAPARAAAQPVFSVGAAVRSIAPTGPAMKTHVGGYGDCLDCDKTGGTAKVRRSDDPTCGCCP